MNVSGLKIGIVPLIILLLISNVTIGIKTNYSIQKDCEVFSYEFDNNTLEIHINLSNYSITSTSDGKTISIHPFDVLCSTNQLKIPTKLITVALPPGKKPTNISFNLSNSITLPVIKQPEKNIFFSLKDQKVLTNDSLEQSNVSPPIVKLLNQCYYHCYNLVDIQINPIQYDTSNQSITLHQNINIFLELTNQSSTDMPSSITSKEIQTIAETFIGNYQQAQEWYQTETTQENESYDYIIITLPSLTNKVLDLKNWEQQKGRTVKIVNTTWISDHYNGKDLPAKIRKFLREKYDSQNWDISYVLIVGSPEDIPLRKAGVDMGEGAPLTDYYYAELSLPDEKSWDANDDQKYGGRNDYVDHYPEVSIGRIPVSNVSIVSHICDKIISFEQNNNLAYKQNMLLLGAFFWNNTDNAALMEHIIQDSGLSNWTFTRLYEQNPEYFSQYNCDLPLTHQNVLETWMENHYSIVNWAGHGSPISAHVLGLNTSSFISTSDCRYLDDTYPSVIVANACSNSDCDYPYTLGTEMMKQGAVGFLGPTKTSFAAKQWHNEHSGSSQSMDYFFTTFFASGNYSLGQAHQKALQEMYTRSLWYDPSYELFEWGTLFGNPDMEIHAIGKFPELEITDVSGGLGLIVQVTNTGSVPAEIINCMVDVTSGSNDISTSFNETIPLLLVNETMNVSCPVWGFGLGLFSYLPEITITLETRNVSPVEKQMNAKIFGPFIFNIENIS